MEEITSIHNPRIRHLLALQQKSRDRKEAGLFVVEGIREIRHCMEAGFSIDTLFLCEELCPAGCLDGMQAANAFRIPASLYERIAYRGSTEGVIATVHARETSLCDLPPVANPLIVVLEGVEKPGNIGAVLRSADAAHADCVILCDTPTDLYNPNLIRASLGAVFTVPVVVCTSQECISFLKSRGIQILTAQLQDSVPYYRTCMTVPTAIVMGTESTGLSSVWREAADAHINIPMLGRLDSLNVSVSTAILLFEGVRQRLSGS